MKSLFVFLSVQSDAFYLLITDFELTGITLDGTGQPRVYTASNYSTQQQTTVGNH